MVNIDLQTLYSQKEQFEVDLNEFSKPFQFSHTEIIADLKSQYIRIAKTVAESPRKADSDINKSFANHKIQGMIFDLLGDAIQEE